MNKKISGEPVLVADNLVKSYGEVTVVKGISLTLNAGRILGFLGPNGAGKTTALRMMTTILEPTSGTYSVAGISSKNPEKIRGKIGVLPESHGFPERISAAEYLTYHGSLYGLSHEKAGERAMGLLKEVGLEGREKSLVSTYSRGMRQRLGIARAIINDPVVIFLDEPTLGLDPRGQEELLILIRKIAAKPNTSVVLCTHLLSDVEDVCDEVVIMNLGEIVATGSVEEVVSKAQSNGVRIHVPLANVAGAAKILNDIPIVASVTGEKGSEWLNVVLKAGQSTKPASGYNEIVAPLMRRDIPVLAFETNGGTLQEAFLQLTKRTTKL
jgi:ABC-2 type transport system ATP-binding protein